MSVQGLKLGYRPADVAEAFGSEELYRRAVEAGMLKPKIEERKLVLYNASDVIKCWGLIMDGRIPPPRKRKTPRKKADGSAMKGADHVE